MIMFRLSSQSSVLEIEGTIESDPSLPSFGDARLAIHVESNGYLAQASAWVPRDDLARFRSALVSLRQSANGVAVLSSMSPGELDLKVLSVSSRGHLAVQGSVGHHIQTKNSRFWHSATFGFEFDQSQLEEAIHASWLVPAAA